MSYIKIFIVTKNKDEPLYNYLEDKLGKEGLTIKEGISELPDVDSLDKEQNNLIVLDDLVNEPAKQQSCTGSAPSIGVQSARCRKFAAAWTAGTKSSK